MREGQKEKKEDQSSWLLKYVSDDTKRLVAMKRAVALSIPTPSLLRRNVVFCFAI